jgi:hypothetical protein
MGIDLKVVSVDAPEGRQLYAAELVLIRPDQIVAWRGADEAPNADGILAQLMGHPHSARSLS